ncbi:GD11055 [Drosophila simulans]|uniref:GD11055 n=1 Tax=Drosophila simulans TaxID=7240 RepID=B4QFU6_DROSI|nr:GD11055 [Drosophila simulans]
MSNANLCHEEDAVDAEEPEDLELDDELLSLSGDEDYDDEDFLFFITAFTQVSGGCQKPMFVFCHISSPDNTQHACWSHNH